jgi:hypothetical protein
VWFWVLAGWLLSMFFSPQSAMGMFRAKKS